MSLQSSSLSYVSVFISPNVTTPQPQRPLPGYPQMISTRVALARTKIVLISQTNIQSKHLSNERATPKMIIHFNIV